MLHQRHIYFQARRLVQRNTLKTRLSCLKLYFLFVFFEDIDNYILQVLSSNRYPLRTRAIRILKVTPVLLISLKEMLWKKQTIRRAALRAHVRLLLRIVAEANLSFYQ